MTKGGVGVKEKKIQPPLRGDQNCILSTLRIVKGRIGISKGQASGGIASIRKRKTTTKKETEKAQQ